MIYYNMLFGLKTKRNFGFMKLFRWENVATVIHCESVLEMPRIFTALFREGTKKGKIYNNFGSPIPTEMCYSLWFFFKKDFF